jgi:hypothetical protein
MLQTYLQNMKFLTILLSKINTMSNKSDSKALYALAFEPTPVLNTPDFESVFGGSNGISLKKDNEGLIRAVEYIALKGTVFEILDVTDKGDHKILHVKTDYYDYGSELFIDSRFVKIQNSKPDSPIKKLPSKKEIYSFLDKAVGSKYIWGGNCIEGIDKMLEFYPPKGTIDDDTKLEWILKGCDCSGLMYEATNGYTERNTSKLVNEGEPVLIEGLTAEEIADKLKPLDMIVWTGHVIYVYDEITAIQSALSKGGVVKKERR